MIAGSRAAETVFFVDSDLFLVMNVAGTLGTLRLRERRKRLFFMDGGREGFVMLFVTFPSDLRSLFW